MIEELLDLFAEVYLQRGLEYVTGREIIEKMGLADQKYLDDYDNRINGIHRYDAARQYDGDRAFLQRALLYQQSIGNKPWSRSRFWYLDRQPLWFKTGMAKRNKIEDSFG